MREKVEASRELIVANRKMVALDLDLPLPMSIESLLISPRYAELIEALRRCEFRSLVAEVEAESKLFGIRDQGLHLGVGTKSPMNNSQSIIGVASPAEQGELFS